MLWLLWQDPAQLKRLYPDESFTGNLGVHIVGRPETPEAAKLIADTLGQFSATLTRRNVSGDRWTPAPLGHVNENVDVVTRQLMTPSEVLRQPDGDVLIRCRGRVIRAQKHFFFEDRELAARARMGGVERADVGLVEPPYHTKLRAEIGAARFARLLQPAPEPPPTAVKKKPSPKGPTLVEAAIAEFEAMQRKGRRRATE